MASTSALSISTTRTSNASGKEGAVVASTSRSGHRNKGSGSTKEVPEKKKFKVSSEQKEVLKEYWDKGMKNSKQGEAASMVKEVAKKTGMTKKQVQNWIGKESDKLKRVAGLGKKRHRPFKASSIIKKKTVSKKQQLHREFMANYMHGKDQSTEKKRKDMYDGMNKGWKEEWTRIKDQEEMSGPPAEPKQEDYDNISRQRRKAMATAITRHVAKLCKFLKEKLKYDSMFLAAHSEYGHHISGSNAGVLHLTKNNKEVTRNFQYAIGQIDEVDTRKAERTGLLKVVQNIYNTLYEKDTGVGRVQYRAIRDGQLRLTMTGLPAGEIFRKPCEYSTSSLKSIAKAEADLQMHVEKTPAEREDNAHRSEEHEDGSNDMETNPTEVENSGTDNDNLAGRPEKRSDVDESESESGSGAESDSDAESESGGDSVIIRPSDLDEDSPQGDVDAWTLLNDINRTFNIIPKKGINVSMPNVELKRLRLLKKKGKQQRIRQSKGKGNKDTQNKTKSTPPNQSNKTKSTPPNQSNKTKSTPPNQSHKTKSTPPNQSNKTKSTPPNQSNRTKATPPNQSNSSNGKKKSKSLLGSRKSRKSGGKQ